VRSHDALVLLYHRVDERRRDPFSLKVSPNAFAEHLAALGRLAEIVPLTSIRDRSRGRRVSITFDDGYADNCDTARPILEQAGMPATVFISSHVVDPSSAAFWWDRLEHLLLDTDPVKPNLELVLRGSRLTVDVRKREGRQRALAAIQRRIRARPLPDIEHTLDQIAAQVREPSEPWDPPPRLNADQIRDLARGGLIDIGGHARSHVMLSAVPPREQWDEIKGGKDTLERLISRPISTFAYPFGTPGSFDRRTPSLVRKAGFTLACTTDPGRVGPLNSRFRVPRLVVGHWAAEKFTERVTRALEGDYG
jgi:peptidoglycan/xylan/chitin deacetylase (PgdA/CDA1 family)